LNQQQVPLDQKIARAWETFWFSQGSTFTLGLFRILFAILLCEEVFTTRSRSLFAIEGGFHLPYISFIEPVPLQTYLWLHHLQFPFIFLLGIGVWMRFSCGMLILLQGYVFFADQMNFRNHPYFFLLVLLLLLLSPANDALSVKALFRMLRERKSTLDSLLGSMRPLTWQRLIQVQLCIVYFYAAFHKLSPGFLRGEILSFHIGRRLEFNESGLTVANFLSEEWLTPLRSFVAVPENLVVLAFLSVMTEFLVPVFLWSRKTRPAAILVGTLFHVGIAFTMNIHVFSYSIIASYLLFLDPDTLPDMVKSRLGGKNATRSKTRASRLPNKAQEPSQV